MCENCNELRTDAPFDQACPHCGTLIHHASAAVVRASVVHHSVEIGYERTPPWFRKWHDVRMHRDKLREMYARTGNDMSMHVAVENYFAACWDLRDWMANDANLPGVNGGVIYQHVKASKPLRICGASQTRVSIILVRRMINCMPG